MNTTADCCSNPRLVFVATLAAESGAKMTIQKCDTCQTYWRVVADHVTTEGGNLIEWDWFEPLTEELAEELAESTLSEALRK